jgi:hypothetical protein
MSVRRNKSFGFFALAASIFKLFASSINGVPLMFFSKAIAINPFLVAC